METQQLRDQSIFPTNEVLQQVLGKSYAAFEELMASIASPEYGFTVEWNYYKDGKSWLCKVVHKKKTIFWLSAWNGFFKTTFFFTEKNLEDIATLAIDEKIKEAFAQAKPIGRLLPLIIDIDGSKKLKDLLMVTRYKKNLK